MKVNTVMQKQVDFVEEETKVRDVAKLIFGRGINGVPVCKNKKITGFITERDILVKFYPDMQDYVDDPVRAMNFEGMEKTVGDIMDLKAKEIMSCNPTVVTSDTPLLRAQSMMFINKIGRLPVVDKKGNLVGIISKGDIFKAVVGDKLPYEEDDKFFDWLAKYYDYMIDWEKRLANEIPGMTALLKKEKCKNILFIGSGTGEHAIALAKEGFLITGIEDSLSMLKMAVEKQKKLGQDLQKKITFIHGDFLSELEKLNEKFDAVIFTGNTLAHLNKNYKKIIGLVSKKLTNKNSVLILQIRNYNKVFDKDQNRLVDFRVRKDSQSHREYAILRFYDPFSKEEKTATLNIAILEKNGEKWQYNSMKATKVAPINKNEITKVLQQNNYDQILFYGGGDTKSPLFKESYDSEKSDWLIVVAQKK